MVSVAPGSLQTTILSPLGVIEPNKWHHIAGVVDGKDGYMKLFINSLEVGSSDFGNGINMSKLPLRIGWNHEGLRSQPSFVGEMDEVRIWNIARSQEEIQETMDISLSGNEPGLVAYWHFDKDKEKVSDLSQNLVDGKLIGHAQVIESEFSKSESTNFAIISGIVKDESGQPIRMAVVRLELNSDMVKWTIADDLGRYFLLVKNPVSEPYDLFVVRGRLGDLVSYIYLHKNENKKIDLTMKESVSMTGNVLMMDGSTPHSFVSVQLIRDGKIADNTWSNENGIYRFISMKPGEYQVRCQVKGGHVYYEDGKALEIEKGKILEGIDFQFPSFIKGTWRYYDTSDGLADMKTHAIYQSPDGALWFGSGSFNTQKGSGVTRYDGKKFNIFTTEDGLSNNTVWAINSEPDGTMWFGTRGGGVSRYKNGEFAKLTEKDGLASNDVRAIHCGNDGNIWFGTQNGVSRFDSKGNFTNFTFKDGLISNDIWAIEREHGSRLWFGTSTGVSVYDGTEFTSIAEDELLGQIVTAIHCDSNGVIWIGTGTTFIDGIGVLRYDGEKFTKLTFRDGLLSNSVMSIASTPDGLIWFGNRRGASCFDGKAILNIGWDRLMNLSIDAVHVSQDGTLWFGTGLGGTIQYDYRSFGIVNVSDGLPNSIVQSSHRECNGRLWIGTGGGIALYDNYNRWLTPVIFIGKDNPGYKTISVIQKDQDGNLWFGTGGFYVFEGGIYRYEDSTRRFTNFSTKDGLAHDRIHDIVSTHEGNLLIGTNGGLSIYDGKSFVDLAKSTNPNARDIINTGPVLSIYRSPDNTTWLGTWGNGIVKYDAAKFASFTTKNGLRDDDIWAIEADVEGNIWFGTGLGISKYDGKSFKSFGERDGVGNKLVMDICYTPSRIIWFGTYGGGVYGYDGQAWTSLDSDDGLSDNRVYSIDPDPDGSLWFSTSNGLTHYCRSESRPGVNIISVTGDKRYTNLSEISAFYPGTRVTMEYKAIDFKTLPHKRQYRCRIRELDEDWYKTTKSELFDYVFDEPGTYNFEVQAIDRDLNYSEPASVELKVVADPRDRRIIQLEAHIREQELAEIDRVHKELEDARQIQRSLLPENLPVIKGFEIAGVSNPAREVSGDFYDYLMLGENLGIILGDVTGKSVKAAMVAAMTDGILHTALRGREDMWNSPGLILKQVNIELQPRLMKGMFTALCIGILNPNDGRLSCSNAGMFYPLIKRNKEVWELEVAGLPLGIMSNTEYGNHSPCFFS